MSEVRDTGLAAREQLEAVDRMQHRASAAGLRAGPANARFVLLLGVLVAALVLAVGLTVHRSVAGYIVSVSVFPAMLQALMIWRDKTKQATGLGWSRQAAVALGATMALYVVGVLLAACAVVGPTLAFWAPFALLTAAPSVVFALGSARRT